MRLTTSMKTALFRLAAIAALPLFAVAFAAAATPAPVTVAPGWKLKDVDGNPVTLSQFKGKVVLLDFWATWCPPCRTEIPRYVALQKKYADDGLVVVGVSVDSVATSVVKKFMKDMGINYIVVMADDSIQDAYGPIDGYPTTFIIDRAGRIVYKKTGAKPVSAYEKKIQDALAPSSS
jgi:cytochrome c biogenesis protein CcmG/thiol:disulfide interchange protein DsbE